MEMHENPAYLCVTASVLLLQFILKYGHKCEEHKKNKQMHMKVIYI